VHNHFLLLTTYIVSVLIYSRFSIFSLMFYIGSSIWYAVGLVAFNLLVFIIRTVNASDAPYLLFGVKCLRTVCFLVILCPIEMRITATRTKISTLMAHVISFSLPPSKQSVCFRFPVTETNEMLGDWPTVLSPHTACLVNHRLRNGIPRSLCIHFILSSLLSSTNM
jgi:hypothetical protein